VFRVPARAGPAVVQGAAMGKRKAPVLDPETTARKVAAMAVGRAAAQQDGLAYMAEHGTDLPACGTTRRPLPERT